MNTRGMSYRLEADPRPPAARAADITNELKLLQARLANGKKNLSQYIPRWVELSNAMLDGTRVITERQVPDFARRLDGAARQALEAEAAKTMAAIEDFKTFLATELARKPSGDWRDRRRDLYNTLHEQQYMFDDNDINLRRIARGVAGVHARGRPSTTGAGGSSAWSRRRSRCRRGKSIRRGPGCRSSATRRRCTPPPSSSCSDHLEAARKSKEWVVEKDLVTIPWKDDDDIMQSRRRPEPVDVAVVGAGAPVPAGSKSRKSAWTIIPPNPAWSDETIEDNLSEKDSAVHVGDRHPRGLPGHHLQRLYQNEIPRKLRVYEGSYSNQAWCYYIEWELTPNYGFYPKDQEPLLQLECCG